MKWFSFFMTSLQKFKKTSHTCLQSISKPLKHKVIHRTKFLGCSLNSFPSSVLSNPYFSSFSSLKTPSSMSLSICGATTWWKSISGVMGGSVPAGVLYDTYGSGWILPDWAPQTLVSWPVQVWTFCWRWGLQWVSHLCSCRMSWARACSWTPPFCRLLSRAPVSALTAPPFYSDLTAATTCSEISSI